MDEIGDNVLAFGAPSGINSMTDVGNRMAGMGRNGDSELVHMKTGEIAVSPDLLEENPRLANELTNAFQRSNVDMDRYTVGSEANSINPMTGQREFFLKKLVKGIKNIFKAVAPILIPMAINFFAPGMGTVASTALGAGIGTLAQGGNLKDAFKSAVLGGFAGGVSAFAGVGGPAGASGFKERAFGKLGGMDTTILRPGYFGTPAAPNVAPAPTSVTDNLTKTVNPTPEPKTFMDTAKGFYNENLSPSRNMPTQTKIIEVASSLQTEAAKQGLTLSGEAAMAQATQQLTPGLISQYLPLAAVGTAAMGALGGFETPEEDTSSPYGRTSREEFESNPNKYSIYSGINYQRPLVGRPDINRNQFVFQDYLNEPVQTAANGGEMFPRRDGYIAGPGTETSDDIPAMLSDGEFVMTSKAVRGLGNGSRKQGVRKMYDMMRAFEGGVVA
tara:strand:- start:422 stop:1753 length:1332 start_codon:yes stop_codon:yes gene_type:complete